MRSDSKKKGGVAMSLANRLKQAMNENRINQVELAALIGKGKSSVSQYISGKNVPKDDVQQKIAEVLGCTVEWLNEDADAEEPDVFKNVPVEVAAKRLGVCPQSVRVALRQGTAPYGYAWMTRTKYHYHISLKKLDEYIGKGSDSNK